VLDVSRQEESAGGVTGHPVISVHADLTPTPKAASQARGLVASALSGGVGLMLDRDLIYTAQLLASELVTNAVLHARTDLQLGICHDEHRLLIAVADGASHDHAAYLAGSSVDADTGESGRGMVLVASLADDFGWRGREDGRGKVMWALLTLDGAGREAC
jgi:anti-sigma regulatory factor (Ser/Thr protein kinase)